MPHKKAVSIIIIAVVLLAAAGAAFLASVHYAIYLD